MLTLQDIFDHLAYGELSNMGFTENGIQEKDYKRIISHINLGLSTLYKRFNLKEQTLKLGLVSGVYTYKLNSNFAENYLQSVEDNQYIKDTEEEPFINDILKVERVYTDSKYELGLNDLNDMYSVSTPSMNVLKVPQDIVEKHNDLPEHLKTTNLQVVYRANHPMLVYKEALDPSKVAIELPHSHIEPLLFYIAARINTPIGMVNEFHAGNSYYKKYEEACMLLERVNLRVDNGEQTNSRLHRMGWV